MSPSAAAAKILNLSAMDETTPLLPPAETSDAPGTSQGSSDAEDDKPLPMGQILLLCYGRLVDPIAFFAIFPFLPKQLHEQAGVPETDVGFYAGLIVSYLYY
jgi:hypothetical protein